MGRRYSRDLQFEYQVAPSKQSLSANGCVRETIGFYLLYLATSCFATVLCLYVLVSGFYPSEDSAGGYCWGGEESPYV